MRVDVLSLFPELITTYCSASILGIAQSNKLLEVHAHNPRDFSTDRHKKVDDIIYGGGAGMLLSPQPFFDCFESCLRGHPAKSITDLDLTELKNASINYPQKRDFEVIICSPSGETLNQALAQDLAQKQNLIIFCGRYEGFDERIKKLATKEISVGDYVLTGGELAALVIIDSVSRLIPGVLGDESSKELESFSNIKLSEEIKKIGLSKKEIQSLLDETGIESLNVLEKIPLLEYPQYTRPKDFRGNTVPPILESGHHKQIFLWRLKEAIRLTRSKRPDLFKV
jgi:tRNA (guanine37-N1)-methyltransferase